MILDPYRWPHLLLPIKRRAKSQDVGIETAVLAAGMQMIDENAELTIQSNSTIFGELPGGGKLKTYDNVDALLDDGWVVD
jgi:hypothetical protein